MWITSSQEVENRVTVLLWLFVLSCLLQQGWELNIPGLSSAEELLLHSNSTAPGLRGAWLSYLLVPAFLRQLEILDSASKTVYAFYMKQSPGNI